MLKLIFIFNEFGEFREFSVNSDPTLYNLPSDYIYSDQIFGIFFYKFYDATDYLSAQNKCKQDGAELPVPKVFYLTSWSLFEVISNIVDQEICYVIKKKSGLKSQFVFIFHSNPISKIILSISRGILA